MSTDKMIITQNLTNEKSSIELDEVKIKDVTYKNGEVLKSISKVPYFPLRDKLVVKVVFEESALIVRDESKIRQSQPKVTKVMATGPEVIGVSVDDEVHVSFNASIEPITFEGNVKSIKSMQDLLSDKKLKLNPIEQGNRKVVMIEYYSVPLFAINGIKTK